ncbi:MAG: prepilin peptidase, partial [Gammaproteobacteria bacterium]
MPHRDPIHEMQALNFLQSNPYAFHVSLFVLGLVIGSFLNVVAYRLPRRLEQEWKNECSTLLGVTPPENNERWGIVHPRSRCPHCGHALSALENIPVLSFLALRGKCSSCKAPIALRYPVIELLTALATVLLGWRFGFGIQVVAAAILTWSLIALGAIDLEFKLLPDDITLPVLWIGVLANMSGLFTDVYSSLIGVMSGYLLLWGVYKIFKLLTGKEGMGYGDFKLLAMLGAWLGWQMLPLIVILSSATGAIIGTASIMLRRQERSQPIPFGPYLAAAGFLALLCGP